MGIGYYEHEIEVRFTESLLNKSTEWQWFIDETEAKFGDAVDEIASFDDFSKVLRAISSVYSHFCAIADNSLVEDLSFSQVWTHRIWMAGRIRAGSLELPRVPSKNTFFDLLDVVSLSTWMLNHASKRKMIYDLGFFTLANYNELFDLTNAGRTSELILTRLRELNLSGLDEVISTVQNNLEGVSVACNQKQITKFLDEVFDADFLSFRMPNSDWCRTWQESYLVDCLKTSIRNDTLEPIMSLGGSSVPEFSLLTLDALLNMRQNLVDPRARCIIDTVAFFLHDKDIPVESVKIANGLAVEHIRKIASEERPPRELGCTSVDLVSLLLKNKYLSDRDRSFLLKGISTTLKDVDNVDVLAAVSSKGFPLSSDQKRLIREKKKTECLRIDSISSAEELLSYLKDDDVHKYCDQALAEKTMRKFESLIENAGQLSPSLFIAAMNFFIGTLNNQEVDGSWSRFCLIDIQRNWSMTFYKQAVSNMHVFSNEAAIAEDQIDKYNSAVLDCPFVFVQSVISLEEKKIDEILERICEYPLIVLAKRAKIDEYIPHEENFVNDQKRHSVDAMLLDEIHRVNEKFAYRYRNKFKTEELACEYCRHIDLGINVGISIVRVYSEMYSSIGKRLPDHYRLIDYPAAHTSTLAHVCQFFPIIENTIRDIGVYYGITPFRASRDEFHILKDAPQILADILNLIHEVTGTIEGAEDILFVYYAMFSQNGFNIRNACVHGQAYQAGASLEEAFRLVVICEYILLYRLDLLKGGLETED